MATTKSFTAQDLPTVFSDVTPVPQDDGPAAVAQIDYSQDFVTAFNYFRAVLQADERSKRALQLTALCLEFNPANYSVWHYRRLCLEAVGPLTAERLEQERQLAAELGGENPKNYQIWYHRRALMERLVEQGPKEVWMEFCRKEMEYTAQVFGDDTKNYHSWCYRQWVVKTMNLEEVWNGELEFAGKLILEDVRNNSAWNQRWFAAHRGNLQQALSADTATTEADYALAGAGMDPYNESPWRYLIAVLKEQVKNTKDQEKIANLLAEYQEKVVAVKSVLQDAGKDPEACPNLNSVIVDLLEWKGDPDSLQAAMDLTEKLANELDPVREKYWKFRSKQLSGANISK
jgi:protein farnesyltransferase/geranylgeranyltransferase type-1 subunit alpha